MGVLGLRVLGFRSLGLWGGTIWGVCRRSVGVEYWCKDLGTLRLRTMGIYGGMYGFRDYIEVK